MADQTSLYRRFRPRTFDDVVGQVQIVKTLRNAIDSGRIHHAYLFVGSRGTGKTSMAKILASALNCDGGPKSDFSPDDPACIAIANGTSLDVIEMDAASNNSVDDIRDLREKVALAPVGGKWKVYILDEAHMLSTAAWNAFLKTLEEPPPQTVFVLATTEADKVLPTIVDRCHRFDFQRPPLDDIGRVLRRAAESEEIDIEDEAVTMLARAATGSFRDALGTLEQIVTYSGNQVKAEDVQTVLGLADTEMLLRVADAIAAGDQRSALLAVQELVDGGRELQAFARDLTAHLRQLLVIAATGGVPPSFGLTDDQATQLTDQSKRLSGNRIAHTLDLLNHALGQMRGGSDQRLQLELALFKAARPETDTAPDALLARLDALEQRPATPATDRPATPPAGETANPAVVESPSPTEAPPPATPSAVDRSTETQAITETDESPQIVAVPDPIEVPDAESVTVEELTNEDVPLEIFQQRWNEIVDALAGENSMLGAVADGARPVRAEPGKLVIGFPESAGFLRKKAENPESRALLTAAIVQVTGHRTALSFETVEELAPDETPPRDGIDADDLIARLKTEFNAKEIVPE